MSFLNSVSQLSWLNAQSLLGIVVFLFLAWLLSENKKRFPFGLLVGALGIQIGLILILFAFPASHSLLSAITGGVGALAAATSNGTQFVFGYLGGGAQPFEVKNPNSMFVFAMQVLPLIVVLSALSALLWHWHVLRWIIKGFGILFQKTIGLGGASSLGVSSGIFLGNVESLILIKAYLDRLSRSELFVLMSVGLANVAGSTMIAYVMILSKVLPDAAGHVLAASIISTPAAVLLARIIIPETKAIAAEPINYQSELIYDSSMDAITKGTAEGLNIALSIAAILVVMVSLVSVVNMALAGFGPVAGEPLSLERILGLVFAPLAWLMGIETREILVAGKLLGVKMTLTEFVAFIQLGAIPPEGMSERTRLLLTYALCGFANIGSVGISVSGFSVLMPDRRGEIMNLIWKALIVGFLATCLSAAVIGAMPEALFFTKE
jgi:CNT family concentrative nucleoside transporter